jgi:Lrp/AsnC family transcriptional regulator for asnA, asnC and gidA
MRSQSAPRLRSAASWGTMMDPRLDRIDMSIVAELSADGRRPYRAIARKLGIAEGTVRSRVAKMRESGAIRFSVVGTPAALGVACNALVLIRMRPRAVRAAAERLAAISHIRFVGTTLGSSDIAIQTLHSSFEDMHRFVTEELPAIIPDLTSTETLQLAQVLKSEWNWAEWFRDGTIGGLESVEATP